MARKGGIVTRLYRWLDFARAGLVLAVVGVLVFWGASELDSDSGMGFGGMLVVLGVMILYLGADNWYCQNCGQQLGKRKPRKCGRCGSNRMQQRDPGVGEAVRVKRQR